MRRYGRGRRYLGGGGGTIVTPPSTLPTLVSSPVDDMATADPVSIAAMRDFLGLPSSSTYGGTGTVAYTSVRNVTGPDGAAGKAVSQFLQQGTWGMPNSPAGNPGTGISMTSTPLGGSYEEARISYDYRIVGSGAWAYGGKLPGLGGIRPGSGGVPTGGSPSPDGWSLRAMHRRNNANLNTGVWRGYLYSPQQAADTTGTDRETGVVLNWNTWNHAEQYHKMNTVTTEGSTSPPANGVHRMWHNGDLVYENLAQVYRLYQLARITHLVWDVFLGGADDAWSAPVDMRVDVKNLIIQAA